VATLEKKLLQTIQRRQRTSAPAAEDLQKVLMDKLLQTIQRRCCRPASNGIPRSLPFGCPPWSPRRPRERLRSGNGFLVSQLLDDAPWGAGLVRLEQDNPWTVASGQKHPLRLFSSKHYFL